MSKTHRLHKIIRHCVDQTSAQRVVFVGKEADIRPYLTDDCIIRTGEDELIGADVLVYLGEDNPAQRADLVRTAKVVLVDESNSHDRRMSLEHGCHGEIHLGAHLGQQFCLDRAYPPFIVYTHIPIADIYSFAGYDSEEASEKFSTVSCFFYETTGELETTTSTTSVPADEPTTTLAPVPPTVEPVADTTTTEVVDVTTTTLGPDLDTTTSTTDKPSVVDSGETTTPAPADFADTSTTQTTTTGVPQVDDNTTATGGETGELGNTTPEPTRPTDGTTTTESVDVHSDSDGTSTTTTEGQLTTTTEQPVDVPSDTTTVEPTTTPVPDEVVQPEDTTTTGSPESIDTTTTGEPVNDTATTTVLPEQTPMDDGSTTTTEVPIPEITVTTSDPIATTTTVDPERQRALDLFDNKPLSKMTDEEKQLLKDQGLI